MIKNGTPKSESEKRKEAKRLAKEVTPQDKAAAESKDVQAVCDKMDYGIVINRYERKEPITVAVIRAAV